MAVALIIPFFVVSYVVLMWKGTTLFLDPEAEALQQSTGRATRFDPLAANNFVLSIYACLFTSQFLQERANGHQVPLIFESHPFLCWCFSVINLLGSLTSFAAMNRLLTIPPPISARFLRWCSMFFMSCAAQMLLAAAFWLVFQATEQGNPGVSPVSTSFKQQVL